jgi:hypothetical protein
MSHSRTILRIALLAWAVALLAALPTGAAGTPQSDATAHSAASSKCVAKILSKGKYVTLFESTYRYKFVRVKKGSKRFKRVIRRVKVAVRVTCAKQCVLYRTKKGKKRPVYSIRRVKVKARHGNKIVTVKKRRRVYKYTVCKATGAETGVPVAINVLDGSYALLDFGSFQRKAPVRGQFRGFIPGTINLKNDTQITLTKGQLNLGQTNVFIDDDCGGQVSSSIRTGDPSLVKLDGARTSTSTLFVSGSVTATAYTLIRLPLEFRNDDDGCTKPYITSGYTEFAKTFFLKGKLQPDTGLTRLQLVSAPDPLDVEACLSPGSPTQPCSGFIIPLPIIVSTKLFVQVDLSPPK